jgi:hypothetical protein
LTLDSTGKAMYLHGARDVVALAPVLTFAHGGADRSRRYAG